MNKSVHFRILATLLEKFPSIDLSCKNSAKETPMALAIKARGFWKCMKILIKYNAEIPDATCLTYQKHEYDCFIYLIVF